MSRALAASELAELLGRVAWNHHFVGDVDAELVATQSTGGVTREASCEAQFDLSGERLLKTATGLPALDQHRL